MKRIIIVILCIAFCFALCSCGNEKKPIVLTTDNFEQYVKVSCYATGASSAYESSSGKYNGMIATAECSGMSGYTYNNVKVTIQVSYDDGKNNADPKINLTLRLDGSAEGSQFYTILKNNTYTLGSVTNADISKYSTYSIVSVSGTVTKD